MSQNNPLGAPSLTTWTNPTSKTVVLRLRRHGKIVRNKQIIDSGVDVVTIPPGESVQLPSYLDDSVQTVRGGVVQSGRGPQLVKNGVATPVHPSLDPNETARREAERAAAQALEAKRSADSALLIAHGTMAAAEAVDAQTEKAKKKAAKADAPQS